MSAVNYTAHQAEPRRIGLSGFSCTGPKTTATTAQNMLEFGDGSKKMWLQTASVGIQPQATSVEMRPSAMSGEVQTVR